MKVSNNAPANTNIGTESTVELKAGETYSGVIKERVSNDEAVVQIRGKDFQVKFEDGVPKGDRVSIQVANIDGRTPVVKSTGDAVNRGQAQSDQDLAKLIRGLGNAATPELKQAIKLVMSFDIQINNKVIDLLKNFLSNSSGTDQLKLDSIKALLTKNIELNMQNLNAVHIALHDKPVTDLLLKVVENLEGSHRSFLPFSQQLIAGRQIPEGNSLVGAETNIWTRANANPNPPENDERHAQINHDKSHDDNLQTESRLSNGNINTIHDGQSSVDQNAKENILTFQHSVRSNMEEVINILQNKHEYEENEYLQNFLSLPAKEYIITAVTQKLAEVTDQFKNIQREIARNLDNIQLAVQQARGHVLPQIKPLLENTIDLIDKAILKSDIMLFTDMKTEKELLQASSHLADARRLLAKGDVTSARQIVEAVKNTIRNLDFRPVDVKVQHYIAKNVFDSQPLTPEQRVTAQLEHVLVQQQNTGTSPRAAFELLRTMGLNYDSEVAQSLSLRPDQLNQDELQRNLKAAIMQLMKGNHESNPHARTSHELEQVLNHLTGQQLLSKSDASSNLQSLHVSIPVTIDKQVENLQVIVNSKQPGHKIDWENCSIYFLIETKKMGATGILLNATDRNLAITLKNDLPTFKANMEPLVSKYKDRLKEIGYNIKGMQFTQLSSADTEQKVKQESKPTVPVYTSSTKGFDFKI